MDFVEPCAGSAAVARRLVGAGKLVGFMGGKDGYADAILDVWPVPRPDRVVLNDPGLWGLIWDGLSRTEVRDAAAKRIRGWSALDAREVFELAKDVREDATATPRAVAAALCRIAGTYGGGEIGGFKGRHKLRPNVDGFIPSRAALAGRVASFEWPVAVSVSRAHAVSVRASAGDWAYVDPPYSGTSGYLRSLKRPAVVALCRRLAADGANVAVSEGEPVGELVRDGWSKKRLTRSRRGQGRRNSRSSEEWLTYLVRT